MKTLSETWLPQDAADAVLVGRVWRPDPVAGPSVVAVRNGQVFDITPHAATLSDLLERADAVDIACSAQAELIGPVETILQASMQRDDCIPYLLAPCDLQPIKACGVTFTVSLLERVIEEQAHGDPARARALRLEIQQLIGVDLTQVRPGSEEAARLRCELLRRGAWSQYMEVAIGPDAEVFSKAFPMSAVGGGAQIGLLPASHWNNPEPEVVLAVSSHGRVVGATLGNDVNLRDIEGRSALLLGKAKDNNGSCAIGPFVRLFDGNFDMEAVRRASVSLRIEGSNDGFVLEDVSHMDQITRDPADLVAQVHGAHHQYPDGFMLFLGTMFSPIKDRGAQGGGFTHHVGDVVTISAPALGGLVNTVGLSTEIPPWTFGIRALYANLAARGFPQSPAAS